MIPIADPAALGAILVRLEHGGVAAGPRLDAEITQARGFEVLGSYASGARGLCRPPSRGGARWERVPRLSTTYEGAASIVPLGWHHGVARRESGPHAWVLDPAALRRRFFECFGRTVPMALLRAALHAEHLVLREAAARSALPAPTHCRCEWAGPEDARLFGARCPDCGRIHTTTQPIAETTEDHGQWLA